MNSIEKIERKHINSLTKDHEGFKRMEEHLHIDDNDVMFQDIEKSLMASGSDENILISSGGSRKSSILAIERGAECIRNRRESRSFSGVNLMLPQISKQFQSQRNSPSRMDRSGV